MTYSFDIFDTCLCRLCGEPRQLFDVLSLRMMRIMGRTDEEMRQRFVSIRHRLNGEGTLQQIYNRLSQYWPLPCSTDEAIAAELQLEREMSAPIVATRCLVEKCRKEEGARVMFISDMYLPEAFVKELLVNNGFYQEGDILYVSQWANASKYDGTLFRLIHEREQVPYSDWQHHGDNYRSDYLIPKSLGIDAHHLCYGYLPYEQKWREEPLYAFQYGEVAAGISRALRLGATDDEQAAFVCDLTAPFIIPWMVWVLRHAEAEGLQRLYFCARDMHSPYHVAKRLASLMDIDIEMRYIYISRRALADSPDLCLRYLLQEGLLETPSAIVDTFSHGHTLLGINRLLAESGYGEQRTGYFICGDLDADPTMPMQSLNHSLFYASYSDLCTSSRLHHALDLFDVVEQFFSLNHQATTVGYELHGSRIRPALAPTTPPSSDLLSFVKRNIRQAKVANDTLLFKYADAFVRCGLEDYYEAILHRLAMPTLFYDFVVAPKREYLRYLSDIRLGAKPYVGSLRQLNTSKWRNGTAHLHLPRWIARTVGQKKGKPWYKRTAIWQTAKRLRLRFNLMLIRISPTIYRWVYRKPSHL